jgi:hypothetical protein
MNETAKVLLGPALALIPVLVWELVIKPSRIRRNLAILLVAELELNLEELAYYRVCREHVPDMRLVNLMLPRVSFLASQASLGELPPESLRELIRFYSITDRFAATHEGLESAEAAFLETTDERQKEILLNARAVGRRALERLIEDAWTVGTRVRFLLDRLRRDGWHDEPPALLAEEAFIDGARSRHARLFQPAQLAVTNALPHAT